jgi:hypothetical protein
MGAEFCFTERKPSKAALEAHGAISVVAGALLLFGTAGAEFFEARRVPLEAVLREANELWTPASCPLCLAGQPLEDVSHPADQARPSEER